MVQADMKEKVAGSSGKPASKSKKEKKKRKSTFYSFPLESNTDESLPEKESLPKKLETNTPDQAHTTDQEPPQQTVSSQDSVSAVEDENDYDVDYEIKTRKSEDHWYMIYYDGTFNISDDEDGIVNEIDPGGSDGVDGTVLDPGGIDGVDGTVLALTQAPYVPVTPKSDGKQESESEVMVS